MNEFKLWLLAFVACVVSMGGSVNADPPAAPEPPSDYVALVDWPTYTEIWFTAGAGAHYTRHEISVDGGETWQRLDDDYAPVEYSTHSLPEDSTCLLRAKSVSAAGVGSAYCDPVIVVTGSYFSS